MTHNDWTTCTGCGKRGYYSKTDAKNVRQAMGEKGLSVYRCQQSGAWHLGHKPRQLVQGRISRAEIVNRVRGGAA